MDGKVSNDLLKSLVGTRNLYGLLAFSLLAACQPSPEHPSPTEPLPPTPEIIAIRTEELTVAVELTATATQTVIPTPSPIATPLTPVYPLDNVTCLDTPTLIRSFDTSQDGTILALTGHDGLSVVRLDGIWSVAGKREEGQFILASLSPDGQRLAAVNKLDDTLFIWDVGTLQRVHQLTHRSADDLTTLAWSSMGSYIAVGGRNGKVVIWDAQSGEAVMEFELYEYAGGISSIAWSPVDEKVFIVGSLDGGYAMIDLEQQSFEGAAFWGQTYDIDIRWSPSGLHFSIAAQLQGHTSVFRYFNDIWELEFSLDFRSGLPTGSAWSPSGEQVALYGDEKIAIYDAEAGGLVHEIEVPDSSFHQALWAPDGRHLYTRFIAAPSFIVWDVEQEQRVFESGQFFYTVTDMREGGSLLFLSVGVDNTPERAIAMWDTQTMRPTGYILGAAHPLCGD